MEWMFALIGAVVGFILGVKAARTVLIDGAERLVVGWARDRNNYLHTLRRELANWLMQTDPDAFHRLFMQVVGEAQRLQQMTLEDARAQLATLSKTYTTVESFDQLGLDYRPYGESFNGCKRSTLEQRYRDIIAYQALSTVVDPAWKALWDRPVLDGNLEYFEGCIEWFKDARLRSPQ